MNTVELKGYLRDIQPSHKIGDVEYEKANLIVQRKDGKEDVVSIKFKKFSNLYDENDLVSISGNLRSYSKRIDENKSKVDIYVFTYFDLPEDFNDELNNIVKIDGKVCKLDSIRINSKGQKNIHLTLANNIDMANGKKLNSYIPCVAWDSVASRLTKLGVNSNILVDGELHSREYKKMLENGEYEIRIAHELLIKDFEVIDEI